MLQATNPPIMYYKGTPYGLGGVTMVDKHSVMTMLYFRQTGDSEDVITLSEDFDHFDLLVISGKAYISDGLWHQSNAYICDSLAVGNRVSIGDDGSISWFDIYDKTTLSRALDSGNPYQITHVMGVKFNGMTAGGGGGSTIELVDIFNGASDITPTYTNGVTVTTSSVTSNVGAMSCSEWSNGYEGFNIALSNLTVGEVYTLNFDFQFTNADYFAYNAYRTGFQLFAVDNRNYELYNTWPANLHRDNGLHNHKKKFTATASTMYLSFNLCGCSDNRTNYFEITNLYVQTTNASEDIGYSTDEQVIGTWIDGKPLYRKVITDTIENCYLSQVIQLSGVPNDIVMIKAEGSVRYVKGNLDATYLLNDYSEYPNEGDAYTFRINFGTVSVESLTYRIIIEYTKTTD